jgi:PHP domain
MADTGFVELAALSNFTFLEGASHPHELVEQAKVLGHTAIGIADRNSFAGLVRGHVAAAEAGLPFVPGARVRLLDGHQYLTWPTDRDAYGRLARLLSKGRMEALKGECHIGRDDLISHAEGLVLALLPPDAPDGAFAARLRRERTRCAGGISPCPCSAPRSTASAVMTASGSTGWRRWRARLGYRCSPRAACATTTPAGGGWPTCSPPSASASGSARWATPRRRTPRRT